MTGADPQRVVALAGDDAPKPPVLEYRSPTTGITLRGATIAARIVAALAAVAFGALAVSMYVGSRDELPPMMPAMLVTIAGDGLFILIAAGVVGRHTRGAGRNSRQVNRG